MTSLTLLTTIFLLLYLMFWWVTLLDFEAAIVKVIRVIFFALGCAALVVVLLTPQLLR